MVRFYGISFRDLMALPISVFWLMSGMIERLRAEETLAILPAHASAMGGEGVEGLVADLRKQMGTPAVVTDRPGPMKVADEMAMRSLFGGG